MEKIKLVRHPETNELIPEIWKDVQGYEGLYKISNYGRVKSMPRPLAHWRGGVRITKEKLLKQPKNSHGYPFVGLYKDKIKKDMAVHRLVAIHFIANPENKPEVNHLDGDKENPIVTNLAWSTRMENEHHAWEIGIKNNRGENQGSSRLKRENIHEIRDSYNSTPLTQDDLAKKFNVTQGHVSRILSRETWSHI